MNTGDLQMASDLHFSGVNLLANMPLPEGCGGMLFQSFRAFLIVLLTVVLTGGLAAMLWKIIRGRLRAPGRPRLFPEPVFFARPDQNVAVIRWFAGVILKSVRFCAWRLDYAAATRKPCRFRIDYFFQALPRIQFDPVADTGIRK